MKLNLTVSQEQRETFEFAAWWRTWNILPGVYELKRCKPYYSGDKVRYVAECDAVVTADYFASHFGGLAISDYDTKQNVGTTGKRNLSFSVTDLLTNPMIQLEESEYDAIVAEALEFLKHEIDIRMRCLQDSDPHWMNGHAQALADLTKLYTEVYFVAARRKYNAENPNSQWDSSESYVKRVS